MALVISAVLLAEVCAGAGGSRPTAASVMDGVRVLYNNDGENLVRDRLNSSSPLTAAPDRRRRRMATSRLAVSRSLCGSRADPIRSDGLLAAAQLPHL